MFNNRDILQYPKNHLDFSISNKIAKNKYTVIFLFQKKKNKVLSEKYFPAFSAKLGQRASTAKRLYVGLGQSSKINSENFAEILLELTSFLCQNQKEIQIQLPEKLFKKLGVDNLANLIATSFAVSSYDIQLLKSQVSTKKEIISTNHILSKIIIKSTVKYFKFFEIAIQKFVSISKHINAMRQVQSLPSNFFTSEEMEKRAAYLALKYNLKLKVYNKKQLKKMGADGILAVNQGSKREPKMIVLEYTPKEKTSTVKNKLKTLALVGKGVTFDTGGISLKPSAEMHDMKYDMSGSAAVIHSIAAIAELELPVKVIACVGMVENMPDGKAQNPGDVYKSLKGLTIEVQNTDAEGRLVLADLLYFTDKKYKPDLMIDMATLTGAILVALGSFYAGLFSHHKSVHKKLLKASKKSLEPLWSMPIGPKFRDLLKSNIADYNNIGGRLAGSSSAAEFLSLFVSKKTKWAHLDIAGTGFISKSTNVYPSVATGYGIRLMVELADSLCQNH